MAQEPNYSPTQFPVATKTGAVFNHPVTGQSYVYGGTRKRAWRLLSDIENRIYTGANSPDDVENLKHGDLWWDTEHMELRVYHKVYLQDVNGDPTYSEGVWISSTHPMMDPDAPDKMKQFGTIIVTPPERLVSEGSEFKFTAHLPYATAPLDEWEVSATVSPSYFGTNPDAPSAKNSVSISFDNNIVTNPNKEINGSLGIGMFPPGEEKELTLRVTITVRAKTGMPDEFYESYYRTHTDGGFVGKLKLLPKLPPLIVNTLPFYERMDDSLRQHADSVLLEKDEYNNKATKTVRFETTNPTSNSDLILVSRIDGADYYTEDESEYPKYEEVPIVALDAKTSGSKAITFLFKYGDNAIQSLDAFYESNDENDSYGVIRNEWQNEFIQLGNVDSLIRRYRLAFFIDGEDIDTVDKGQPLWTQRYTEGDMGRITSYVIEGDLGTTTITGEFIGLSLNVGNTVGKIKQLDNGRYRLYFACIDETQPQIGSTYNIEPTTKGYIDIEPFSAN